MTRGLKFIPFFLLSLTLIGCAGSKVISNNGGVIVVKGPRVAWRLGRETCTEEVQQTADKRCAELGREKEIFIGGKVKPLAGDYNRFFAQYLRQ